MVKLVPFGAGIKSHIFMEEVCLCLEIHALNFRNCILIRNIFQVLTILEK